MITMVRYSETRIECVTLVLNGRAANSRCGIYCLLIPRYLVVCVDGSQEIESLAPPQISTEDMAGKPRENCPGFIFIPHLHVHNSKNMRPVNVRFVWSYTLGDWGLFSCAERKPGLVNYTIFLDNT